MSVLLSTLLSVFGAVNVWTESSLVRVFPESIPTRISQKDAHIYAARGERESFQLCVRAEEKGSSDIKIEAGSVDKAIAAPEIRRVGYLRVEQQTPRNLATGALWPDPLLDLTPFNLAPGETAALWVTYTIPPDARAGSHHGKIAIDFGGHRKSVVNVAIEVFDFALPEMPTLRTAFPLERKAIRSIYGFHDSQLDTWKPIYDALNHSRISYRVWELGDLVTIAKDGSSDTSEFKTHLEYTVTGAHMNSIDVGAGISGVAAFPPPPEGEPQDPLQFFLHDMGNWLQEKGWLDRAYIEVMALPERAKWQQARDAYFRVQRNDKRFKRLLVGAGDPYFERYTEIWATPLRDFDPYVDLLLRQGFSLTVKQVYPAKSVDASSCGGLPGAGSRTTQPEDGYDGCLFTYWMSKAAPKRSSPEWLEVTLDAPVTTDVIKVIWKSGFEGADLSVSTALNGPFSTVSEIKIRPFPPISPYAQSWAEIRLEKPETFRAVRLEFAGSYGGGPVGVTELLFGDAVQAAPPDQIPPLELWLATAANDLPSLAADAHPVEARIFPWICWGHQSAGFVHRGLCRWPSSWRALVDTQPQIWPCKERTDTFLFYPGRNGPMPSIRAELLRDGLEDYEYLAALDKAVREKDIKLSNILQLCARRLYPANPAPQQLDAWAGMILKDHVRLGLALNSLAGKGRP